MSKSLDDHKRARRRVFLILLLAHLVVTLAVLAVYNVRGGHYEVIDAPARGFQHCFEIGVNLLGLRFDIAFTDDVAGLIRSGLASDEQELAALVENSLAVARPRVVQRFRLDDLSCHGYASWVKSLDRVLERGFRFRTHTPSLRHSSLLFGWIPFRHLVKKIFLLQLLQKAQVNELLRLGAFRLGHLFREHIKHELNTF